ncbi:MAG: hypothetical protein BWZ02_00850 [Lentisphaerae bacterium ADurb.BinA184]|nr:MAG: hypothetical protein BWZ02_00850 [Lentisphaerae bacterium ADurb.BinA184]
MLTREARERDEFATPASQPGLRVVQITADDSRDSENVYMDCNSWTPDSKRFAFWRRASADGSRKGGLWLCDTEDGFAVRPILEYEGEAAGIEEFRKTRECFCGAGLAPDGRHVYEIRRRGGTLELFRIGLADGERVLVCTAPAPLTVRGCLTLSSDSRHLLFGAWLGDGRTEGAPWGAYIFDLEGGTWRTIEFGNGFRNMHCQYSKNPAAPYDVSLIGSDGRLSDGSWLTPPDGSWRWQNMPPPFPRGEGALTAHHVVRDDGTDWRMVPLGDGGDIVSGGHNGFLGDGDRLFCAVYDVRGGRWRSPVFEAAPVALPGGRENPEYWRGQHAAGVPQPVDLSRKLARADSCHLACDLSGRHFVSDTDGYVEGKYSFLWIATRIESADEDPWLKAAYLLLTRSSYKGQPSHAHPLLSPDARFVVFQSDFSGRPQVHVAYDFEWP